MLPPLSSASLSAPAPGGVADDTTQLVPLGAQGQASRPPVADQGPLLPAGRPVENRVAVLELSGQWPAGRGVSGFAEVIGSLLKVERRADESLSDYMARLVTVIRTLSPAAQNNLQQALSQWMKGLSIDLLLRALANSSGPEATKLALLLETEEQNAEKMADRVATSYQPDQAVDGDDDVRSAWSQKLGQSQTAFSGKPMVQAAQAALVKIAEQQATGVSTKQASSETTVNSETALDGAEADVPDAGHLDSKATASPRMPAIDAESRRDPVMNDGKSAEPAPSRLAASSTGSLPQKEAAASSDQSLRLSVAPDPVPEHPAIGTETSSGSAGSSNQVKAPALAARELATNPAGPSRLNGEAAAAKPASVLPQPAAELLVPGSLPVQAVPSPQTVIEAQQLQQKLSSLLTQAERELEHAPQPETSIATTSNAAKPASIANEQEPASVAPLPAPAFSATATSQALLADESIFAGLAQAMLNMRGTVKDGVAPAYVPYPAKGDGGELEDELISAVEGEDEDRHRKGGSGQHCGQQREHPNAAKEDEASDGLDHSSASAAEEFYQRQLEW